MKLDQINFARDIMELKIYSKNEDALSNLDFTVRLTKWTETYLELNLNFSNPTLVSKVNKDILLGEVVQLGLFQALTSNQQLKKVVSNLATTIPKQLPANFPLTEE